MASDVVMAEADEKKMIPAAVARAEAAEASDGKVNEVQGDDETPEVNASGIFTTENLKQLQTTSVEENGDDNTKSEQKDAENNDDETDDDSEYEADSNNDDDTSMVSSGLDDYDSLMQEIQGTSDTFVQVNGYSLNTDLTNTRTRTQCDSLLLQCMHA